MEHEGEVAHTLNCSLGRIIVPTSLDYITEQLWGIQANMDIIRVHRYEDSDELVAYMNNIQFSHNKILEQLDNLWRSHHRTGDHLRDLEAHVEHIEFHMHEPVGYYATPPVLPPDPPPWYATISIFVLFVSSVHCKATEPGRNNECKGLFVASFDP